LIIKRLIFSLLSLCFLVSIHLLQINFFSCLIYLLALYIRLQSSCISHVPFRFLRVSSYSLSYFLTYLPASNASSPHFSSHFDSSYLCPSRYFSLHNFLFLISLSLLIPVFKILNIHYPSSLKHTSSPF
jgi:hypothetical protein